MIVKFSEMEDLANWLARRYVPPGPQRAEHVQAFVKAAEMLRTLYKDREQMRTSLRATRGAINWRNGDKEPSQILYMRGGKCTVVDYLTAAINKSPPTENVNPPIPTNPTPPGQPLPQDLNLPVDYADSELAERTEQALSRLASYGGTVFNSYVADALESLAQLNEDLWNQRDQENILESVGKTVMAVDNVFSSVNPDYNPEPRFIGGEKIPQPLRTKVLETLEAAHNGLAWYRETFPESESPVDDEMEADIVQCVRALELIPAYLYINDDLPPVSGITDSEIVKTPIWAAIRDWHYAEYGHAAGKAAERIREVLTESMQAYGHASIEHFLKKSGLYLTNDASREAAMREAVKQDRSTRCKGQNCSAVDGHGHSPECLAEHDASVTGIANHGRVPSITPGRIDTSMPEAPMAPEAPAGQKLDPDYLAADLMFDCGKAAGRQEMRDALMHPHNQLWLAQDIVKAVADLPHQASLTGKDDNMLVVSKDALKDIVLAEIGKVLTAASRETKT